MRGVRGILWPAVLGLLCLASLFTVAKANRLPEKSVATPTAPLVVLAEPTATVIPTATIAPTATPTTAPTATVFPTATSEPTAVPTAEPTAIAEPTRAEPASRGGARPQPVAPPPPPPTATRQPTAVPPPPPPPPTAVPAPAVGGEIGYSLNLINGARAAAGLPGLTLDGAISNAARLHAEDMGNNNYLAHVNRQGQQPWDRMRAAGAQFGWASENLGRAWGAGGVESAIKQMHEMMMAERPPDDGHRVNVLSPRAKRVGIGVARVNGWVYWVCDFAD